MRESTAAELLFAQLTFEVEQAKMAFTEGNAWPPEWVDMFQDLVEKIVKRWWIGKMVQRPNPVVDMQGLGERMIHRTNALVGLTQAIINRSGSVDPNSLQVSVLGMSAEINAVWGALIEAGLMTPANRQDYMDAAVSELYKRGMDECQKIIMTPDPRGRPS
jgi:hypothetical protein